MPRGRQQLADHLAPYSLRTSGKEGGTHLVWKPSTQAGGHGNAQPSEIPPIPRMALEAS